MGSNLRTGNQGPCNCPPIQDLSRNSHTLYPRKYNIPSARHYGRYLRATASAELHILKTGTKMKVPPPSGERMLMVVIHTGPDRSFRRTHHRHPSINPSRNPRHKNPPNNPPNTPHRTQPRHPAPFLMPYKQPKDVLFPQQHLVRMYLRVPSPDIHFPARYY